MENMCVKQKVYSTITVNAFEKDGTKLFDYEKPVFEKQEVSGHWNDSFPKCVVKEINNIILPDNACLQCSGCHGCR